MPTAVISRTSGANHASEKYYDTMSVNRVSDSDVSDTETEALAALLSHAQSNTKTLTKIETAVTEMQADVLDVKADLTEVKKLLTKPASVVGPPAANVQTPRLDR